MKAKRRLIGATTVMQHRKSTLEAPSYSKDTAIKVTELTDRICADHLDDEYAELCRKLIRKLARKRPSPLLRGELRIWAGAVIYTIGVVNFLFDPTQCLHLTQEELSNATGVVKSTLQGKSRLICDMFRIGPFAPEYCRRELLPNNPLAWLVQLSNGFIVDARELPPHFQAEARRRGLIPDIPLESQTYTHTDTPDDQRGTHIGEAAMIEGSATDAISTPEETPQIELPYPEAKR